ncbi:MAG: 30S ribosomal protein S16 [Planctomycetota bacterium]
MAVRLRLKRMGRKNRPSYRIVAADSRSPRDGKVIEILGHYDPVEKEPEKQVEVKADRVQYWLSVGAQASETVAQLLEKQGIATRTR